MCILSPPETVLSDTRPNVIRHAKDAPAPAQSTPTKENTLPTLGALKQTYSSPAASITIWVALILIGGAAMFVSLIYGFLRAYQALNLHGPAAVLPWSQTWFLLALVTAVVFILLILVRIRLSSPFVAVYKGGVIMRRGLWRTQRLLWMQIAGISTEIIEEVFMKRVVRTYQLTRIFPNVGKPISLPNSVEGLPELTSQLKASLYPRLLPSLEDNFHSGQWLYFGPIGIQSQALRCQAQVIPWEKIKQIRVHGGDLLIELSPQGVRQYPLGKIPNVELLLQLIGENVRI